MYRKCEAVQVAAGSKYTYVSFFVDYNGDTSFGLLGAIWVWESQNRYGLGQMLGIFLVAGFGKHIASNMLVCRTNNMMLRYVRGI